MKKIQTILFAALLLVVSCSRQDYIVYEDDIASKVYFPAAVTSRVLKFTKADVAEKGFAGVTVYCSGNNSNTVEVTLSADEYALEVYNVDKKTSKKMLPEEYWSLEKLTFVMDTKDNHQTVAKITFDFELASSDGIDFSQYLLPLSLSAGDRGNLNYDYQTILIEIAE